MHLKHKEKERKKITSWTPQYNDLLFKCNLPKKKASGGQLLSLSIAFTRKMIVSKDFLSFGTSGASEVSFVFLTWAQIIYIIFIRYLEGVEVILHKIIWNLLIYL